MSSTQVFIKGPEHRQPLARFSDACYCWFQTDSIPLTPLTSYDLVSHDLEMNFHVSLVLR